MNRYEEKYKKIVNELIRKDFSELGGERINVVEIQDLTNWSESFSTKGVDNYYIFMFKKVRDRKEKALKGQIAHELCHLILNYKDKNLVASWWHLFKKILSFGFNTNFSRIIETNADKETIKRGYSKELIELKKDWLKKFGKEKIKELGYSRGYLSPEQIKSYAKKIRRW